MARTVVRGGGRPTTQGRYSFQQLRQLWVEAGGSPYVASIAAAIALAESGGNPLATNKSLAGGVPNKAPTGLWQIYGNPFPGDARDPRTNARMAVAKWKGAGHKFTPWTVYTGADTPGNEKTYRKYLPGGSDKSAMEYDVVQRINPGKDPVGDPLPALGDAADAIEDAASAVPNFLGKLSDAIFDPDWWLRVGLIALGLVAFTAGVAFMGKEFARSQIGNVAKTVINPKR